MSQKTPLQDSNYDEWVEQEILNSIKNAAEADEFLFGDYDYETE